MNHQDNDGNTALIHACQRGDLDMAMTLVALGANKSLQNHEGQTAAQVALANGYRTLYRQLSVPR